MKRDSDLWTPEQFRDFIQQEADPAYRALWTTVTFTGVRISDILALIWSDLDRESNTISITRCVTKGMNGGWAIGPAKTKRTRVVAVPALLWELFNKAVTAHNSWVMRTLPLYCKYDCRAASARCSLLGNVCQRFPITTLPYTA